MEYLRDVATLMRYTHSCRDMRSAFQTAPSSVSRAVITNDLGVYLPTAVARLEATTMPWTLQKPPRFPDNLTKYQEHVAQFCDEHLADQQTKIAIPTSHFSLEFVTELSNFHSCVLGFAPSIVKGIDNEKELYAPLYVTAMGSQEFGRVVKTLYFYELVGILLPLDLVTPNERWNMRFDIDWTSFWKKFAPWELFQYEHVLKHINYQLDDLVQSWTKHPDDHSQLIEPTYLDALLAIVDTDDWYTAEGATILAVALHAGLKTMECPNEIIHLLLDIWIHDRWEVMHRDLYVVQSSHHIWLHPLEPTNLPPTTHSLDIDHLIEKYGGSDLEQLEVWFYDLVYEGLASLDPEFYHRFGHKGYIHGAFTTCENWHTKPIQYPTLDDFKLEIQSRAMTQGGEVIRLD
ncbi:Uu.00g011410.m01.CDS01 [Anthostomella pinea]|uniref:Uu.00g011410.m01.CDS01 n=1 Tax=Anthostomella pinea TaxID=933095 RepID=A0AAI8YMT2_9PEZI|nr:Uu.00g011410.m01.CDS01 [Anthostomella pinea]